MCSPLPMESHCTEPPRISLASLWHLTDIGGSRVREIVSGPVLYRLFESSDLAKEGIGIHTPAFSAITSGN